MAEQIYCSVCTCRTFLVMLQEDGSVEVFCQQNNHRRVLVNIPELVENVIRGIQESYIDEYAKARSTEAETISAETSVQTTTTQST